MGIVHRNANRLACTILTATLAGALSVSTASAQAAAGNWGAEGRIGSGQTAFVSRWFNANWSLLLGGGLSMTNNENPANNSTNEVRTVSVQTIIRREWGTTRVHPFIGFGPVLNLSHSVNESPTGGGITKTTSDNVGFGGRFEFGAFGHVSQFVDLGVVLGASGTRNELTTKVSGSAVESKSNSNSFALGNPQFVIRVRF